MSNRQERIVYLLMALNAAVFAFLFVAVSANYRLAADDFHYLVKTKELGVWDSMVYYYHNWNPRWSSTLVTNLVLGNNSAAGSLLVYHVFLLGFGFVAVRSFLFGLISRLRLPFSAIQQHILALYILGVIFHSSFSKDDTWFWVTVSPMYLLGSFAAGLGGSFLVQRWFRPLRLLLVALLFLYAGGASETVAIVSVVVLCYLGFVTHKKQTLINLDETALHVATISCLIGFGIDLIGPGARIRFQHLPQFSFTDRSLIGCWNYAKFVLKEIPLVLPMIMIGTAPFAFFGRKQLRFQLIALKELVLVNRKLWILFDLIILILAFALAFAMAGEGPTRAWLPITFMVMVLGVVFAYQLGTWVYIRSKGRLFQLVVFAQVVALGYQGWVGADQIRTTGNYAEAVDARMSAISRGQLTGGIRKLTPLPDSGWLYSAEITADTSHFTNRHLKLFFGSDCAFAVKDNVISTPE